MKHTRKLSAIILSAVMLTTACANNVSPGGSTGIKDSSSDTANSSDVKESNGGIRTLLPKVSR